MKPLAKVSTAASKTPRTRRSMKRSKPMSRGKALARSSKPMKRGKRLGKGKKTLAKDIAMAHAIAIYFKGQESGTCQLSGANIYSFNVKPHHKTPRSELRKAGIKDLDVPKRLLIIHPKVHIHWLHAGKMGRPKEPMARDRYARVEATEANAVNGQQVELCEQDRLDLERFMRKHGI